MDAEKIMLDSNGWVPNNARFPVLVYRSVQQGNPEIATTAFERLFASNGWPAQWRDTIYDYHHYHSTAHEALGIASGHAVLELGGPGALRLEVQAWDALILPAGTGHRRISQSDDFLVVGAYPAGQEWDICRDEPTKEARKRIESLPAPSKDAVTGSGGWTGEAIGP